MEVPPALADRWEAVVADTEATAEEYRDEGWEALALHPGDVKPITDDAVVSVLLSGTEFDAVHEALDGHEVEAVEVFGADDGGVSFRLVVAEVPAADVAVCVPTYLLEADAEALRETSAAAGGVTVRLRPLDDRDHVTFSLADPGVYLDLD